MKQFLKILLILFVVFIRNVSLYAQKEEQALVDSLLKELPKAKEDTNKVKLLKDLSYAYSNINPDEGIKYGQIELDLATKLDWKKGIADGNNNIGINYDNKSDYPHALDHYQIALKIDEKTGDKNGVARVTSN